MPPAHLSAVASASSSFGLLFYILKFFCFWVIVSSFFSSFFFEIFCLVFSIYFCYCDASAIPGKSLPVDRMSSSTWTSLSGFWSFLGKDFRSWGIAKSFSEPAGDFPKCRSIYQRILLVDFSLVWFLYLETMGFKVFF